MQRTIIISNRLPVKIQRKDNELTFKPSEGGLATGLGSIYRKNNNLWMGWPGTYFNSEKERTLVKKELAKASMLPVFLTKDEIRDYYEGFSNETLWPTFHYFPQYAVYKQEYWDSYVDVNKKFCDQLVRILKPGDQVWIHDYQLLLLPQMLRERFPQITIGFFLHIPFPSYEILRQLPWSEQLLQGMLGADLLGFHTFDYARHFLSSLSRALGISNTGGQVFYDRRLIVADAFPMGIDYDLYENTAKSSKAISHEKKLRKAIGERKTILAVDRLDYTKGIPERLEAFAQFLEQHPEYREKVSLVQVLVPSRDKVEMYKQLKEEINRRVGSINSDFGSITWTPVYYFYRSFPPEHLAAMYRLADIALVTPLRDGMNLVAKEYIAAQYDKKGVLVLSKLAGAAIELHDSILVNPNDMNEMAEAIHKALTMPAAAQKHSMESMQAIVRKFNIHHWVDMFMYKLNEVKDQQHALLTKEIDDIARQDIKERFTSAGSRLLLLDYDGTLVQFKDDPAQAKPDRELLRLLQALADDPANKVVVVSGRDRDTLDQWINIPGIDVVAEHGAWIKMNGNWKAAGNLDDSWKEHVRPVLTQFADRAPGAFIEEKAYSLAWHYRKLEHGLGQHRSGELINHLRYVISGFNLQVLEGDMVVEFNKGRAVSQWLVKNEFDFIIGIGDDNTDEDMFRALPGAAITIKVRTNVSAAKYHLKAFTDVRKLLKEMSRWGLSNGNDDRSLLRA
jgi:trehalose 6-phosphate synthase/phosphatase